MSAHRPVAPGTRLDTLDNLARDPQTSTVQMRDVVRHLEDAHGWEAFEGIHTIADAVRQHEFDHWGGNGHDGGHTGVPVLVVGPDPDPDPRFAPTVTVTVTVPLHPQALADKCAVATVLGDVRESLEEACGRFAVAHAGRTVQLHAVGRGRGSEPPVPSADVPADDASSVLWDVQRSDVERIAGRALTDDEVERVAQAIGHSSIPDALHEVVFAAVVETDDDEDEDDET